MSYNPSNPNGQATSANSSPVVIASDQSAVPVSGTVSVTGVATATNQTGGGQKTQIVDGSGNVIGSTSNALNVNISSGGGSSTQYADGAARGTATGTLAMGDDGTNIQSLKSDSSGVLAIQDNGGSITVDGSVTANAGTNLNTSALALETGGNLASIKTDVDNLNLAQGSTTSGQKGSLPLGAVTTSAPSYTTAQSSPLSLTTAGGLRVDGSGTTQPVSGTVTANIGTSGSLALDASVTGLQVAQASTTSGQKGGLALGAVTTSAPTYTTAQTNPLSLTTAGALRVDNSANTQPVSGTVTATNLPTTVDTNSGNKSASTLRVVLATDQPQLTNKLLVTPDANSAINVAQVGGSSVSTAATGVQKVGVVGNAGATVDSTVGAGTAPANAVIAGAIYNSTEISPTTGQAFAIQADSKGRTREVIMDAAGNTRGANVNASNQLSVSVDNSNVSTNIAQVNGVTVTTGNGVSGTGVQRVTLASDSTGQVALATGTNAIGSVNLSPTTSGGWSTYHLASAASTNATNIKASAGQVGGWFVYNSNAAMRKLVFHNTSGTPTAGSSVFFAICIPPGAGANVEFTNGIPFSTGIAITTVTGLADSDATAVAANDLIINIWYK